jgi:uncharacterized protein (DUF1330 family)
MRRLSRLLMPSRKLIYLTKKLSPKNFSHSATQALATGAGYKVLSRGAKTISIDGAAPKSLIAINHFDNMDEALKAYNSAAYKDARKIGDKSTFRIYVTEGQQ